MNKNTIIATSMAMMLSTPVVADTIGVYLGGNVWDNSASGTFGESKGQFDPNLADETQSTFFIAVEHPIPLFPNVRIAKSELDTDGFAQVTDPDGFEFGDETYATGTSLESTLDISYIDYTLYYELFDNGAFSFDFGITARDFESDVMVMDNENTGSPEEPEYTSSSLSANEIVPMLYVATNVGLPLTGFNFYAQGNLLSIDDSTIYDYEAGVSYELIDNFAIDVNLTVGYKAVKLELEDVDDLYSDLEFDGVYAGAVVHF